MRLALTRISTCISIYMFLYHVFVVRFVLLYFFFFSSRRRHTRLQGDWSSDVCSSDLVAGEAGDERQAEHGGRRPGDRANPRDPVPDEDPVAEIGGGGEEHGHGG